MNDRHHPPANQDDFHNATNVDPAALADGWHTKVAGWIADQFDFLPEGAVRFFDGLDPQTPPIPIAWDAFPQLITGYFGSGREAHRVAEVLRDTPVGRDSGGATVFVKRRQQDEYCEWFAHRDGSGRIVRVDFTCEGPEYWEHLGQDHDLVLALYREHVSPDVEMADLLWDRAVIDASGTRWREGDYNPFNKWNTTDGAMHLTHAANTLGAEINLAALATILRTRDGGATVVDGVPDLACCSPFGDVNRSSDPNIGVGVNRLVHAGKVVGLADPIGLYISELPRNDIVDDNGDPAGEWKVTRGTVDVIDGTEFPRILRATVTVPTDREVTVGGVPLEFGGQLAERIQMVLYGVGRDAAGPPPAFPCEQKCCVHPDHPQIRATIAPARNCAAIDWARFDRLAGPFTGVEGAEPADVGLGEEAPLTAYQATRAVQAPLMDGVVSRAVALFDPDSDTITGPHVDGAPTEPVLDVDEIQGAVTPGFGTRFQHLIALRFPDAVALRTWLATSPPVSTLAEVLQVRNRRRAAKRADPDSPPPRTPVMRGLSLTIEALRLLTPDADDVVDEPLRGGLRLRSVALGDPLRPDEDGHRTTWKFGGTPDTTPHVLVVLAAEWDSDLDTAVTAVKALTGSAILLWEQRGAVLDGEVEHFGFRDGISQVGVRGRLSDLPRHFLCRRWLDPDDERALTLARPGQPLVWPGQFVFGYPAGTLGDPLDPGPVKAGGPAWTRNGSLLVLRRLRQDVPAFQDFVDEQTARLHAAGWTDITTDRLAALLVGRWPDGSALIRSPDGPSNDESSDTLGINAFGYARDLPAARVCADPLVAAEPLDALAAAPPELRTVAAAHADPDGQVCPKFAHIRKVNPRDLVTDQEGGELGTRSFQMLRRGITWGTRVAGDEPASAADRGLLFMSYQTDIENQFELLTTRWMNLERAPELDRPGHDLLVGQRNDGDRGADLKDGIRPAQPLTAPPTRRWVIPTGGGYFFTPSVSALRAFAGTGPTTSAHPTAHRQAAPPPRRFTRSQ